MIIMYISTNVECNILQVVLNPALGKVLENLVHCVDCLTKSKENLR